MSDDDSSGDDKRIECPIGTWFHRRMAILLALIVGLALYFLYDGLIGYPQKNFNAALFAAFQSSKSSEAWPTPESVSLRKFSEDQLAELKAAFDAGQARQTWAQFAATKHLAASEPEKVTESEIRQQFTFAAVLGVTSLGVLIFWWLQSQRTLVCDEKGVLLPNGKRIQFSEIDHIDLEKWDRGIAYLKAKNGSVLGKIDDYKYEGAGDVEHRIQQRLSEATIGS